MKAFMKAISLMLVLLMVCTLCVGAFASELDENETEPLPLFAEETMVENETEPAAEAEPETETEPEPVVEEDIWVLDENETEPLSLMIDEPNDEVAIENIDGISDSDVSEGAYIGDAPEGTGPYGSRNISDDAADCGFNAYDISSELDESSYREDQDNKYTTLTITCVWEDESLRDEFVNENDRYFSVPYTIKFKGSGFVGSGISVGLEFYLIDGQDTYVIEDFNKEYDYCWVYRSRWGCAIDPIFHCELGAIEANEDGTFSANLYLKRRPEHDVNCDGKFDIADVLRIFREINNGETLDDLIEFGAICSDYEMNCYDVNGDGAFDIADALRLFRMVNGQI